MSLGGTRQPVDIAGITVDAIVTEQHSLIAEVPEHSVEEGSNISDHVRLKPRDLTLEVVISHTRLSDKGVVDTSRAPAAWSSLKQIQATAQLISIITEIEQYDNMVIQSVTAPRNAENSEGLQFTLQLKQIRIVSNKTVAVPTQKKAAKKKIDKGEQPAKDNSADSSSKNSLTHNFLQSAGIIPPNL
jgi:hypothetical protein